MEIIVQKYEIEQEGKIYNISTQIFKDKLRLTCEEMNSENPLVYSAVFTLNELMQLSSSFSSISNIVDAQVILEKIIMNEKVTIEYQGDYINLKLIIKNENIEEHFTLQLNLYNQNDQNQLNKEQNSYQSIIGNEFNSQEQLSNQYFSSFNSNTKDNSQILYSSTSNQENYSIPLQSKTTETMIYDSNYNNYNYENELNIAQPDFNNTLSTKIADSSIEQTSPVFQQEMATVTKTNFENEEFSNLKDENIKLNQIITQLKSQINILIQENHNLKLNIENIINKSYSNEEIILPKKEVEKYLIEIKNLRNEISEFDEYKRIKEDEINSLRKKIEELLLIIKQKIEEFGNQKQKEIYDLKTFFDELIRKQNIEQFQFKNLNLKQKDPNLENEILSIQNIHLEIIKGDIIEDVKELELLSRRISKNNSKIILNLLYKATIDSDKAEIFHKKCDFAKSTLVLVKSQNGKRFGGYTTQDWKGNSVDKKDENAFVFSLDKMLIYDIIPGEDAIGCYPNYGPIFLGCQIRIFDEFFTKGGTTFEKGLNYNTQEDFELTGGLKKFNVKEIEVYSVELE